MLVTGLTGGSADLSPISLARFEENAGAPNTSTVRLEGTAQYGVERTAAAIRIASSQVCQPLLQERNT